MQGTWSATIVEIDGKAASEDEKKLKMKLVVKDDGYKIYFDDLPQGEGV